MARRYSRGASKDVKRAMHKRKRGTLKSGGSGKRVTSRKQAIAIGLSEARRAGVKLPASRNSSAATKRSASSALKAGARHQKPSPRRARAVSKALKRMPHRTASRKADSAAQ